MRFRLMCDYSADPVWQVPDGYMLTLDELPLSESLRRELRLWADHFESSLMYLARSNDQATRLRYFATDAEEAAFEARGLELWQRVRAELPDEWEVGYYSHLLCEDCWDPADPRLAQALAAARSAFSPARRSRVTVEPVGELAAARSEPLSH